MDLLDHTNKLIKFESKNSKVRLGAREIYLCISDIMYDFVYIIMSILYA